MATTTTSVGETVTRTTHTDFNRNRGLYWGLAVVAIVVITLAAMLTTNRNHVENQVTPSTTTQMNGATPGPIGNDTQMPADMPPSDRGTAVPESPLSEPRQ